MLNFWKKFVLKKCFGFVNSGLENLNITGTMGNFRKNKKFSRSYDLVGRLFHVGFFWDKKYAKFLIKLRIEKMFYSFVNRGLENVEISNKPWQQMKKI